MSPGPSCLVVDDDADQRYLTRRLLERAGLVVVAEAADAEEAVEATRQHAPGLILLDLEMPGRSGLDVLPDLCAVCPTASIVVVSNLPRRRYGDTALHLGAVGYVEKRVGPDQLVDAVLTAAAVGALTVAHISEDLPADPTAAGSARRWLRDLLSDDAEALVSTVELLVSELVNNAVLHASSAPRVEVDLRAHSLRVAVQDSDPTMPARRDPDVTGIGGRGLLLLDRLSDRWGADPLDGGKVVWFELAR